MHKMQSILQRREENPNSASIFRQEPTETGFHNTNEHCVRLT